MRNLFWVALGSALGGMLRHLTIQFVGTKADAMLPWATIWVNVLGCLLIGFLAGRWGFSGSGASRPEVALFWVTGFCGGYTTFSLFSLELMQLFANPDAGPVGAALYAAFSVGACVGATLVGLMLAARLRRITPEQS